MLIQLLIYFNASTILASTISVNLYLVGDNPAGMGRIRVELDHGAVVVLDHFAILPCYRRRGLLTQCFLRIITDIIAYNNNTVHQTYLQFEAVEEESVVLPLVRLAFIVPAPSAWLSQLLLSMFGSNLRAIQLQQLPLEVYRLEIPIDEPNIDALLSVMAR